MPSSLIYSIFIEISNMEYLYITDLNEDLFRVCHSTGGMIVYRYSPIGNAHLSLVETDKERNSMKYTSMTFGRIETRYDTKGLQKDIKEDDKCIRYTADHHLNQKGHNWEVSIKNLLTEDIYKFVSLREHPEKLESEYSYDRLMLDGLSNCVIVRLEYSKNTTDPKNYSIKNVKRYTKEYRISGNLLANNAFFISELGWYLCTTENIDRTVGLIRRDAEDTASQTIAVPFDRSRNNSSLVFGDYSKLIRNCVKRMSKIHVYTGININRHESQLPDKVKDLRIAVMDKHFSPYHSNRMSYDSSLGEDEFYIDNLFEFIKETPRFTFDSLMNEYDGEIYVVDTLHDTMKGKLCELAIFANDIKLADYYHSHQSEELYTLLEERIAHREGNPVLRKTISDLNDKLSSKEDIINEVKEKNLNLQNEIKETKRYVGDLEKTITKLKTNHDAQMSYDAVMSSIEMDRKKLEVEKEKLAQEKYEFEQKKKMTDTAHKVSIFKAIADTVKSGWGLILTAVTVVTTIITGYRKLKSSS